MIAMLFAQIEIFWHLPVMVLLVSAVYSATRYDEWDRIIGYTVRVGIFYILLFLAAVYGVLWLLSSVLPNVL